MKEKILLTGANSMVGRHFIQNKDVLEKYEIIQSYANLLDHNDVGCEFDNHKPNYVIHLATYSGGIKFNREHADEVSMRTVQMGINVYYYSRLSESVKKVITTLPSCCYPDHLSNESLKEKDIDNGLPNESIRCHGLAKRQLLEFSRQISATTGKPCVCTVFNNLYGEYDRFSPDRSKFLAAFIRKIVEAKRTNQDSITFWGDGLPRREVMYAKDAARSLLFALEEYNDWKEPINIGWGKDGEFTLYEYAKKVSEIVGYQGEILWDHSKANGQMRKVLDNQKMLLKSGFCPYHNIENGLRSTIKWWFENYETWQK